jgi:hypothetical protein
MSVLKVNNSEVPPASTLDHTRFQLPEVVTQFEVLQNLLDCKKPQSCIQFGSLVYLNVSDNWSSPNIFLVIDKVRMVVIDIINASWLSLSVIERCIRRHCSQQSILAEYVFPATAA